jgi:hypothetical protein
MLPTFIEGYRGRKGGFSPPLARRWQKVKALGDEEKTKTVGSPP